MSLAATAKPALSSLEDKVDLDGYDDDDVDDGDDDDDDGDDDDDDDEEEEEDEDEDEDEEPLELLGGDCWPSPSGEIMSIGG